MKHVVTAHADIVGSLLRPRELLEARESYAAGGLSAAGFKRIEDRAVDWAIGLQERQGSPWSRTVRCAGSRFRASW